MLDLIAEHKIAMSIFELGQKSAADLHFSGKLQIDSLGDLVVDVPSALLRGCFSAIKEPGAELCVGSSWKARFIVMDREEVETIGSKAISERGKDFDFKINGSSSSSIDTPDISKIWYLDIDCPDAERIRQSYGLKGKPETGFRALFGVRRKRLFTNSSVSKDVKWAKPDEKPGASSGEWKWTKMADLLPSVQLQPHQQALAEEIDPEHPVKKLLMWQVGSGKSLGSIAGAEAYGKPYTVIGPAAMRPSFKSEQKRFTDRALPSEVISYHKAVRSGVPNPESLVFDEAQRIINPSSGQSQAAVEAARNAKQVLMLSGTPVVNRPGDLAPMVNVLTGKNFSPKSFEDRYLDRQAQPRTWSQWAAGQPIQQNPVVRNREELKALLAGKVDWYAPDKPMVDTRYSDHEVEMSPEQTKLYNAMFGKMPLRLRMGMDNLTSLTPKELLRLQAFLAGPRQVGLSDYPFAKHRDPMQSFSTSAKLQLAFKNLKAKLDSDPRAKAFVYSNFPRAGLHPYRAALEQHGIPHTLFDGTLSDAERSAAIKSFNDGNSRVALIGPAGSEGISLRGAQLAQLLDPHWQDARMRQSTARGIRFDSHTHLPEELRNIEIQRYISKLPPAGRSVLQALRLAPYNSKPKPGADDYLRNIADEKEKSNQLFMALLKEVGTRPKPIL